MEKYSLNLKNTVMWGLLIFYSIIIIYYFFSKTQEGATTMKNSTDSMQGNTVATSVSGINSLQRQLNDLQTQINAVTKVNENGKN